MISKGLREVFSQAVSYAKSSRHEYLTIEHIFLMLLNVRDINNLLVDLGVNTKKIFEDTKNYVDYNTPKLPSNIKDEPIETITLSAVIETMVSTTQGNGKDNASIEDMFLAIMQNEKTYATYMLKSLGIQKIDILEELTHKQQDVIVDNQTTFDLNKTDDKDSKKIESLKEHSIELVQLAKDGKIDPVIGRELEINRIVEILSRRKKNNPLLVGEPGVGKTAIVEGLALEIANDNVPYTLKNAKIFSLDMSSLLAGTKYRGDFEKKLKSFLAVIKDIPNSILFIDEIHTIVGAGSVGGSAMDASNILKPLLSNDQLKCMGATTYSEFRNDFSKDKALNRRFSKVDISEPSIKDAVTILEGLKEKYEKYHNVSYSNESLKSTVELSKKFINDRFLPDSAIDVIDEVGAVKKLSSFKKKSKKKSLHITSKDIQNTISRMVNIPSKNINKSELKTLEMLEVNMKKRIFGQDKAIKKVVEAIKINRAGLGGDNKTVGNFLFTGPTGVGKTEVAKELASQLEINFERFDMSEYMEAHTISRLIGAPAGYVGFENGGLLTEAIRKKPYSILLLDEIEKAHPDLMNILLQVMDNASLTDNSGNQADFQNVILIMTSNLGTLESNIMGFEKDDMLNESKAINKFFSPEFRNRLDSTISFASLKIEDVIKVVGKFIEDLKVQLSSKNIKIYISLKAKKQLAHLGYDKKLGARPIARIISEKIKKPLTNKILFEELKNGGEVNIDYQKNEFTFKFENKK